MYFCAFIYGLLTLSTLWSAGGASSELLALRSPVNAGVHLIAAALLYKFYKVDEADKVDIAKTFSAVNVSIAAALAGSCIIVFSKFSLPGIFDTQSDAIQNLGIVGGLCFCASLAISFFIYERYFSPVWGFASAAFLEALTWGLALNSILIFISFFVSSYMIFRFARKEGYYLPTLSRVIIGGLWWLLV